MIVPDVNLLLYATITAFGEHARARNWWESCLNGETPVGLTPPAIFGYVRIATSGRLFAEPMGAERALDEVDSWLAQPHVQVLSPGPRHLEIAFSLIRSIGTAGNLTTDIQLAAYAIENQAELHSNDADFSRFDGLRWVNPLRRT